MNLPEYRDYCWLLEPQATDWLTRLAAEPVPAISMLRQLRQDVGGVRAALLVEQAELRRRGRQKFSAAGQMFFTDRGLQQATDGWIARYKGNRFSGIGEVVDLCCGIGGDLAGLASRGPVVGVERDPVVAWMAQHNSRIGIPDPSRVTVEVADVRDFDLAGKAGLHLDPDRRSGENRYSQLIGYEPGAEFIEEKILAGCAMAVKLAPAAVVPDGWYAHGEREWIATRGECRQQVLWSGPLAGKPGTHRATYLPSASSPAVSIQGDPGRSVPPGTVCGRYLYEPNAAILAAQLVGTAAEQFALWAPWPDVAYLSSDRCQEFAGFAAFEVLEVMPFDRRRIKAWLRERGIGQLEVKKRGVQIDPAEVQRQLRSKQTGQVTLLLAGTRSGVTAVLAQRIALVGQPGALRGD